MGAPRSVALDALRGFALLGIILVNAPFFSQPLGADPVPANAVDATALWFTHAFATGKFFLIFSLLFGFGFAAILARAEAEGASARGRILRRLVGLFGFGMLHAVFLFFGDILMLYALLGMLLWLCRGWPANRLLGLAAAVMLVGIACQAAALQALAGQARPAWPPPDGIGYLGGFMDGARQRIADLLATFAFGLLFNAPVALAMFLAGFAFSRRGDMPPDIPALRRPARVALVTGGIGSGVLMAIGLLQPQAPAGDAGDWIATAAFCGLAPVLSFGMAGTVLDLAHRHADARPIRLLAVTGSATLTGYILHSVLLGAVFNGWGLGLYGRVGPAGCLIIGVLTFVAVSLAIALWKQRFRHGPDEWLLRSFVDLEWKRLRRATP